MQKKFVKIIAVFLTVIMLYQIAGPVASYAVEEFLSEEELESQTEKNTDKNVDFDVVYEDGKHSKRISIYGDSVKKEEMSEEKQAEKQEEKQEEHQQTENQQAETKKEQEEKTQEIVNATSDNEITNEPSLDQVATQNQDDNAIKTFTNEIQNSEVENTETTQISAENKIQNNAPEVKNPQVIPTQITVKIQLKNLGYMEDGVVDFTGANFVISSQEEQKYIRKIENNQVFLNRILGGEEVTFSLIINARQEKISTNYFNKDNTVQFAGTFVNEKMQETKIEKKIILHTEWDVGPVEAFIEQNVTKYIPFQVENAAGLLLQTSLKNGIKNAKAPMQESRIKVLIPRIADTLPEKANVVNHNSADSRHVEWSYDQESGILHIQTNRTEGQEFAWDEIEELDIISLYSKEVLANVVDSGANIKLLSASAIAVANYTTLAVTTKDEKEIYVKDQIGSLVDVTTKFMTQTINKGYLYTNLTAAEENKKETIFGQQYHVSLSDIHLVDEIIILQENPIITGDKQEWSDIQFENKKIVFSKEQLDSILGKQGLITITAGEKVETINYQTNANDQGNITIDLASYPGELQIKISHPEQAGEVAFGLVREISKNQNITENMIRAMKSIHTQTIVRVTNQGIEMPVNHEEQEIVFEEPTSKITATINKKSLSTVVKNENVEINAVLETNSIDDVLYQNPRMAIAFPSYVKELAIANCKALYSDEIKIASVQVNDTENGKMVVINFEGTQTIYHDETIKGMNVVLNVDITTDRFASSKEDKIKIAYTNEKDTMGRMTEIPVKFVAPIGIVTVNELVDSDNKITLINGKNEITNQLNSIKVIDTYTDARIVTMKGQVINNYNNSISDTKILGRIPNTDSSGNTFDMQLQGEIHVKGVEAKVYYSANANASDDLSSAENGWREGPVNYTAAKSFLILPVTALNRGDAIQFEYELNLQEKLSFNHTTITSYSVTYINQDASGARRESKDAGKIALTTGEGPNLVATLETKENIQNVRQGQSVDFVAKIKNIGTDATNVKVAIEEVYGEVVKYNAGFEYEKAENVREFAVIKAGEEKTIQYTMKIKENAQTIDNAEFRIGTAADRINSVLYGTKKLTVLPGMLVLNNFISATKREDGDYAEFIKGENGAAGLSIKNISGQTLKNITVKYHVGEEIEIKEAGVVDVFYAPFVSQENIYLSADKHTVTYLISSIEEGQTILLRMNTEVIAVGNSIQYQAEAKNSLEEEQWLIHSNSINAIVKDYQVQINAVDLEGRAQETKEKQEISYIYSVQNTGDLIVNSGKIICQLPQGIIGKRAEILYRIDGQNTYHEVIDNLANIENNEFVYEKAFLETGEEMIVKITAEVQKFSDEEINNHLKEKELSMSAKFIAANIEKESEKETYYAVIDPALHGQINNQNVYRITGTIWEDENKNSQRDENEIGMAEVQVALFDRNTMRVAKRENGENIATYTNKDGSYEFENLPQGKYLVATFYQTDDYYLTQYQKDGVRQDQNSDAVEKQMQYDDAERTIGLTDVIELNDTSVRNVDVGLIVKDKFDLALTEQVSKVTFNTEGKIKQYSYEKNPEQMTKVAVNQTEDKNTMVVEYQVNVSNEGNVSGYANKIVNYMEEGMKFNSELNPDWYLGEDGNVYSNCLAEQELQPGETKTIRLVLTKPVESSSKEIINVTSEITEEYNEQGIESIKTINGQAKDTYASVEVVSKNVTVTILITILVAMTVCLASGSVLYIHREKIMKTNIWIKTKTKLNKIIKRIKEDFK